MPWQTSDTVVAFIVCLRCAPLAYHMHTSATGRYSSKIERVAYALPQFDIRFNLIHIMCTKRIFRLNLVRISARQRRCRCGAEPYYADVANCPIIFHVDVYMRSFTFSLEMQICLYSLCPSFRLPPSTPSFRVHIKMEP